MNTRWPHIVAVLSLFAFGRVAFADNSECAFIQEKYSSGKPNKASCSMLPEKAYSTSLHTVGRSNHCQVDRASGFVSWCVTRSHR